MRRVVAIDSIDDRARAQNVRDAVLASLPEADSKRRDVDEDVREFSEEADDEPTDVRETEILRLVAASMPSHRSAWKKDGAAWRTFVNRQKAQTRTIPEEDESSAAEGSAYYDESTDSSGPDEETRGMPFSASCICIHLTLWFSADNWADDAGLAKSLPIPIGPLGSRRVNGQAKQGATLDKVSAAAMRRASYAERDRMRMVDPGALDFDVDDEEDEPPNFTEDDTQVGGKSMQLALNILQKHSEIPGAGRPPLFTVIWARTDPPFQACGGVWHKADVRCILTVSYPTSPSNCLYSPMLYRIPHRFVRMAHFTNLTLHTALN